MVTYGGDEVSALVLDVGSSSTRVGFAGEDTPKAVFPTVVGSIAGEAGAADAQGDTIMGGGDRAPATKKSKRFLGETEVYCWRENMDIRKPVSQGLVQNWDEYEAVWDYVYSRRMRINPAEHPLLLSEPAWNPREDREKLMELAFETFKVPAFYLAKSPVLTAFSSGRATTLIIDSGATATSVVPVFEGYVLKRGIQYQALAGDAVSSEIAHYLSSSGIDVVPQYKVLSKSPSDAGVPASFVERNRPNSTESFHALSVERVINDFKETVCHVSESARWDDRVMSLQPKKSYEFPNGYNNYFGLERFKAPEILFNPKASQSGKVDAGLLGIQQLVDLSIQACDADLRPTLYSNAVSTGGTSSLPGFNERLSAELSVNANMMRVKLHSPGNMIERKFSAWVGGSILASLGSFHQMWVSKKEYEEMGPSVEQRLN
ncbi:actin family [Polychytrium aggregatum]|uniref:actin family n=1 Tax=Polychytrium aggregatum TaxID=110093 RepID=UPI0022FF3104|nr:actin family [Polychytrium aggregatum]KAI9202100.1 actin family [Polychytrium aggregatum]